MIDQITEMIKGASTDTLVRTIVTCIAAINAVCAMMGLIPLEITENMVYSVVSSVALVGSAGWSWWKNNSFTPAAKEADALMKELKTGIGEELIEEVE